MKFSVTKLLLLVFLVCSCFTGGSYASSDSNPATVWFIMTPYSDKIIPGDTVTITYDVTGINRNTTTPDDIKNEKLKDAYVYINSNPPNLLDGASGYTDENGEFTATFTVPDDLYERTAFSLFPPSDPKPHTFPMEAVAIKNGVQEASNTFYVTVLPKSEPQLPEFPSIALPIAAILSLIVIFGRKKNIV
jgi:hypothetical protein